MSIENIEKLNLNHIGIIMDGNRRWAKRNLLANFDGHKKGVENFKSIARYCNKLGIKYLTVYAFSTENWKRTHDEIKYLLNLFKKYLKNVINEFDLENTKIKFVGNILKFSKEIQDLILILEQKTQSNTGICLNIAVNYGSREEICSVIKLLSKEIKNNKILIENLSEDYISNKLLKPDVDLIIRTGGEQRLSNFLLWQSAYAEFYFTDVLWPDFSEQDLKLAILEYSRRTRRFGGA